MKGKFSFKFNVGENGNLEELSGIKDANFETIHPSQIDPRAIRFLKMRLPYFEHKGKGSYLQKYKKVKEDANIDFSQPTLTLYYKLSHQKVTDYTGPC